MSLSVARNAATGGESLRIVRRYDIRSGTHGPIRVVHPVDPAEPPDATLRQR